MMSDAVTHMRVTGGMEVYHLSISAIALEL